RPGPGDGPRADQELRAVPPPPVGRYGPAGAGTDLPEGPEQVCLRTLPDRPGPGGGPAALRGGAAGSATRGRQCRPAAGTAPRPGAPQGAALVRRRGCGLLPGTAAGP